MLTSLLLEPAKLYVINLTVVLVGWWGAVRPLVFLAGLLFGSRRVYG